MNVYLATLRSTHNPWTIQSVVLVAVDEIEARRLAAEHVVQHYGGSWKEPTLTQLTEPVVVASMSSPVRE